MTDELHISNVDLEPPWMYEPLTRQVGPIGDRGDARAPEFGPGYELSAGEVRPSRHELTYSERRQGDWTPDFMTGTHGVIGQLEADHYGFVQPWDIETTIDRSAPSGSWDEAIGSSVPSGGFL